MLAEERARLILEPELDKATTGLQKVIDQEKKVGDQAQNVAVKREQLERDFSKKAFEQSHSRVENLKREFQESISEAERYGAKRVSIDAYYTKAINDAQADALAAQGQKLKGVGQGLTVGVTMPILAAGAAGLKFAASMESSAVKYGVLLGDMSKGIPFTEDLKKLAAETPLAFGGLDEAAQKLLGFQVPAEGLLDKLRMLGDLSKGNSEQLQSIALAYGKMSAAGRADMETMNILIGAGVPILGALAKEMKVNGTPEIRKMTEAGKIGFGDVEKALKSLVAEGGLYHDMMKRVAETAEGKLSTSLDSLKDAAGSAMESLIPLVKDILDGVTGAAEKFSALDEGSRRAILAMLGVAAASGPLLTAAGSVMQLVAAYQKLDKIALAAKLTMLASSPVGWAIAAGAAIAGGIALINKAERDHEQALKGKIGAYQQNQAESAKLAKEYQALHDKTKLSADEQKRMGDLAQILKDKYPGLTQDTLNLAAANKTLAGEVEAAALATARKAARELLPKSESRYVQAVKELGNYSQILENLKKIPDGGQYLGISKSETKKYEGYVSALRSEVAQLQTDIETYKETLYGIPEQIPGNNAPKGNNSGTILSNDDKASEHIKLVNTELDKNIAEVQARASALGKEASNQELLNLHINAYSKLISGSNGLVTNKNSAAIALREKIQMFDSLVTKGEDFQREIAAIDAGNADSQSTPNYVPTGTEIEEQRRADNFVLSERERLQAELAAIDAGNADSQSTPNYVPTGTEIEEQRRADAFVLSERERLQAELAAIDAGNADSQSTPNYVPTGTEIEEQRRADAFVLSERERLQAELAAIDAGNADSQSTPNYVPTGTEIEEQRRADAFVIAEKARFQAEIEAIDAGNADSQSTPSWVPTGDELDEIRGKATKLGEVFSSLGGDIGEGVSAIGTVLDGLSKKLNIDIIPNKSKAQIAKFVDENKAGLQSLASAAESLAATIYDAWKDSTTSALEDELDAIDDRLEAYQKYSSRQLALLEANGADSIAYQLKVKAEEERLEKEKAAKEKQIARKEFEVEKKAKLLEIAGSTAVGIAKAWSNPVTAPWVSALIGGIGIAQAAIVAAQNYPAAYDGAILPGTANGSLIKAGERGQSEAIIPLRRSKLEELGLSSGSAGSVVIQGDVNVNLPAGSSREQALALIEALKGLKHEGLLPKGLVA